MDFPFYAGMCLPIGAIALGLQHKSRCHAAAGFGERDWYFFVLASGFGGYDLECGVTPQTADWADANCALAVFEVHTAFLASRRALGELNERSTVC